MDETENYNVQIDVTVTVYIRDGKVSGFDVQDGWGSDSLYVEEVDPETGEAEEIHPLSVDDILYITGPIHPGRWKVTQE